MEKQTNFGKLEVTKIERDSSEFKTYEVQWTIPNYSLVKPDKLHIMHNVLVGTQTCHFKLYKKQKNESGDQQPQTDLILTLQPSPSLTIVKFSIIGANNREILPDSLNYQLPILKNERQVHFVETPDLIVDDTLTISVTILVSVSGVGLLVFQSIETSNMALGSLLESGMFSDLQIVVGEDTFQAHRAVLCSRSSVLAAMFENNLKENVEKRLRIDDADTESVGEMLNYIYTGETRELNWDLATNLFQLADKYDLQELRFKMAVFLMQHMSMDRALGTLVMADMHNHLDLKDYTTEYIGKNLSVAMQHRDWESFRKLHDDLFQDVLEHVAGFYVPRSGYGLALASSPM